MKLFYSFLFAFVIGMITQVGYATTPVGKTTKNNFHFSGAPPSVTMKVIYVDNHFLFEPVNNVPESQEANYDNHKAKAGSIITPMKLKRVTLFRLPRDGIRCN